jgi:hypothetical protein
MKTLDITTIFHYGTKTPERCFLFKAVKGNAVTVKGAKNSEQVDSVVHIYLVDSFYNIDLFYLPTGIVGGTIVRDGKEIYVSSEDRANQVIAKIQAKGEVNLENWIMTERI